MSNVSRVRLGGKRLEEPPPTPGYATSWIAARILAERDGIDVAARAAVERRCSSSTTGIDRASAVFALMDAVVPCRPSCRERCTELA